jgi:hypothetical protein
VQFLKSAVNPSSVGRVIIERKFAKQAYQFPFLDRE